MVLCHNLPSVVSTNVDLYLQRIVRLGGAVDDDNSNLLVAQLLYLDSIGKKDITMYVNSPGGSVTAGQLPLLSCMQAHTTLCATIRSIVYAAAISTLSSLHMQ